MRVAQSLNRLRDPGPAERSLEANFAKAMSEARRTVLQDMEGVSFQTPDCWVRIGPLTGDSVLLLSFEDGSWIRTISSEGFDDLIKIALASPNFRRSTTDWIYEVVVSGEGSRLVPNWPSIVLHSGWTVADCRSFGISWCITNRRISKESWK